jgi:predicted MFS family arabinose efflux permease
MAVAMLPLALIPHWGAASFGFMGVVALFTLTAPAFAIAQQEIVPPAWRSTMAGAISMTTGLGTAAVAFGGGYVITDLGYQTFFVAAAVLAAIGGLLFWGFTWVPRYVLLHEAKAAQNL